MKFLVDECLTEEVAHRLNDAGHDAIHLKTIGLLGASDLEVMAAASVDDRILVSGDTDFGELLAKGGHVLPSVILLRRDHAPTSQAEAILGVLPDVGADLIAGAVVVIMGDRVRVRSLPIL